MATLFETTFIKNMSLANRFVRSATWEGMAGEDGSCTPRLLELMVQLARGGVGLIITGHTYVSPEGQAGPWQLGVSRDELVAGLAKMTEAVHQASGKVVMQLAHAGVHAASALSGQQAWGPSVLEKEEVPKCREMDRDDIQRLLEAFGEGAARAQKAGFDGVQIHAAHGYLLSQFLSPFYNRRTDAYGGNIENRARIVLEVFQSVRNKVGDQFPVMIKLNSEDFVQGGLTLEETLQVVRMLEKAGIDAVELSGGMLYSGKLSPVRQGKLASEAKEVYYREAARRYKANANVPLMLVGGIRSYGVAERLVSEGLADYVSLSRPLICEPALVNRWQSGDTSKAKCQSDNLCFTPAIQGEGIYCVVEKRLRDKEDS